MAEYKEQDRPYVARQLNGPVISAFIKAVYNFFHKDIDDHCDYFKKISIDTANTEHLYFIGKLMGLQLFNIFTDQGNNTYLTYAYESIDAEEEYEYNNGWSSDYTEHVDGDGSGVFGTGAEKSYPVILTREQYKNILDAVSEISSAPLDSVKAIDTLTRYFMDTTDYSITYNSGYVDVINVVLGESIHLSKVDLLQNMFDRLLEGGTVTVLVSHI